MYKRGTTIRAYLRAILYYNNYSTSRSIPAMSVPLLKLMLTLTPAAYLTTECKSSIWIYGRIYS